MAVIFDWLKIIDYLQQIDGVSPTGRYSTAVPLLFVLSCSAVKEIIEDYVRINTWIFCIAKPKCHVENYSVRI
jgi:hypothetical protein